MTERQRQAKSRRSSGTGGRRRSLAAAPGARERELEIVGAIAEALNASTEVGGALSTALALIAQHLSLHTGWIFLYDDRTGAPYLAAAQNLPPGLADEPRRMTGTCFCLDTLSGDPEAAANVNVVTCSRLSWLAGRGTGGLRFHASIPIHFQGRCLGVMNVASTAWRELTPSELRLMRAIGDLLGVAVDRARLYARSLEAGAIEERNRLAREIHDTVAQGLAAIAIRLDTVDALLAAKAPYEKIEAQTTEALRLTRQNLDEVRRSVLDLRAAPLEGRTLGRAISDIADRATKPSPRIDVRVVGDDRALPPHVEAGLFRIAQEALANAIQHGKPHCVALELTFNGGDILLSVEDDGVGFATDAPAPGRFGLIGLRERARLLGGALDVTSAPGAGTRLFISVPIDLEAAAGMSDPIRVLIADDHPVVRDGLSAMLATQEDIVVAGTAGTGVETIRLAESLRPDVVLLDIEMPEGDGVAVTAALAAQKSTAKVIVFTAFDRDEQILRALQAGAEGYLLKGTGREEVFRAIRAVHEGRALIEPVVAAKLLRRMRRPDTALTPREKEVLPLVARGLSNKLIARELGCAERTAKFHVSSLLHKLGASNRTEAVAAAREQNLL